MTRSGAAAGKLPKCKLFNQLMFVRDTIANRKTVSNLDVGDSNTLEESLADIPPKSFTGSKFVVDYVPVQEATIATKRKTEKTTLSDKCDVMLIEAFMNEKGKREREIDADESFAESIIPILQKLPEKKNRMAKIEIQQILMRHEFHD